jgi:ribonucleoside-diphosphate reductase beta chain
MADKVRAFNRKDVDFTKQYMFFGEQPNVARYDIQRYPIFEKLIETHHGFFWTPQEVNLTQDAIDFKRLSDHEKHIFIANLKYQTLLDSVQGRAPNLALLPFVSLPELETYIETWSFSETMHSRAYTHILRNILASPSVVFDDIIRNTNIMDRAEAVTSYYDDVIKYGGIYNVLGEGTHKIDGKKIDVTLRELKRKMVRCVASINILEGVRFYVSFACAFAFAENGVMEGNAKEITLIARDENLHLAGTQNIIKKWYSGQDDPEMQELWAEEEDYVKQMYLDAVQQEKDWANYLFKDGSMMGLNDRILNEYMEYIAGKRMRAIGIKNDFSKKNPLSWTDKYLISSNNQVAPQETEITSYVVGGVKYDLDEKTFDDITL